MARGAREPRQRDDTQADGARSLHEHAIGELQRRAIEGMHGCDQPAAAADVVLRGNRLRKHRADDTRLEVDRLAPSAEQSVARGVSDAVDLAADALRGRRADRTRVTAAA